MKSVNKDTFITLLEYEAGSMPASQRNDIKILLAMMIADKETCDIRHAAYMLATVKHETDGTYAPVEEIGKGRDKKYGQPDHLTGKKYYGRGYVQLTWSSNYMRVGSALGIDLFKHPEQALKYDVAYRIMSRGMRLGMFTGRKLFDYIHDDVCDYINARRIINGTDCAAKIAGYAVMFESILKNSLTGEK